MCSFGPSAPLLRCFAYTSKASGGPLYRVARDARN